ncbi:glycogenin 1 isoform X1 [Colletes latitarsis]|uniref:glycogenin 1 isoform X1 n=1 Tax=Colletes latitarsis TaxID=2605962 RepID=UPI004035240E
MGGYAWVTLATNDAYSLGALVLAHSLRRVGTKHELAVLVTPGVTETMREKLAAVFSLVTEVNVLDSKDEANLALLARPELGITFTKLHCWRLTLYDKCVFLDADTLVIRNCDELFEREELSAAPDVGWPDCFNSGVFVYKPSQQTFASITAFAANKGSFDGGDQGLLNMYFSDWAHKDISKHLPFIYNMCSTATYSYLPAFKQFGNDVRIIHFIGITKPWLQYFDTLTGIVQPPMESAHLQPLLQLWWNIFCEKVHPHLSPVMAGLAGALAQITLGEPRSAEQIALEEHMRKQSWEQGQIDYMGLDSFDNIWKKICQTLSLAPTRLPSPPKETQKSAKSTTDKTIESVESTESLGSVQPAESIDEVDKETAQATISHTEEQSLVNNVPITDNDNIVSKLSEEGGEFINTTSSSAEKNKNGQTVSEEIKDISEKSTTRFESESHDMIIDPFSTQSTTQTSPEKPAEEFSKSLLLRGVPRETTIPIVPCDLVQSCSIGEQKVESCNKDNVSFITPTEVLASTVTNLEITIDAQQIKQPDIRDEKHANELSTASEVLTVSPVPIQVAESVLQMEPKESVSDSQTVTEEVLSSTITPVHESNVLCFKTDLENKVQVNGSTSAIDSVPNKEKLSSDIIDTVDKLSESSTKSAEISQILPLVEQLQLGETSTLPLSMAESTETYTDTHLQVTESIQEIKESESCTKEITEPVQVKEIESCTKETMEQPVQQVKETVDSTKKTTEAMDQIKKTESCTKGTPKSSAECEVTKTSQLRENPVRPSRAKELNVSSKSVPETPQDLKSQEKATTKKVVKKTPEKSASETDPVETAEGDGTGKKVVKKVVKKVAKKSKLKPEEALDDGAEECSSHSKQKKTVKLVKKGTKTLQTPDIDTTVSETPSSSTSDTPVPPKRKVKATATKSVVKKSDVE